MFFSVILALSSSSLIFDKDVGGKKSEINWLIEEKNKLIEIIGSADQKKTEIFCDLDFYISSYFSEESSKNDTFKVTKTNNELLVEKSNGSSINQKQYNINGKNWVQDFSFGLRPFFASSKNDYKFEIINPKDLVMRTMVATKEEIEMKTFNGIEYRARRVKVTLDGFYKKFWKAELWYDTKTYNLLYYKANEGPSTPYTVLTLKELKK
jgi:hypothetical protein